MNTPTVLPNADTVKLTTCEETYHLRQGDVFVTPRTADAWLVINNGKNAVSLSTGELFIHNHEPAYNDLMAGCRVAAAVLIIGALHLVTGTP